jgi:hypothetical protein
MKKLIILFSLVLLFSGAKYSNAQVSETTLSDIIETASDKVKSLENSENMEVVNLTIDLLVGSKGEKYVYRYLDNSFDYKIYAVGDRRISKLNVQIRKQNEQEKWILVDKTSDSKVQMDIYPDSRAFYEFKISVADFKEDNTAGHFTILIYHLDPTKK